MTAREALHAQVLAAREAFMRVLTERPQWRCSHCGHAIPTEEPASMPAIWEQADPNGRWRGSVQGIAHCGLLEDGLIVADSRWRVSLPLTEEDR